MSKKSMSKNAIIKKVKKLERQKKHNKALNLCDNYLDNNLNEEIIQIKTDVLTSIYYTDNFADKANKYKKELNHFLNEEEYIEILKIYKTLETFLQTKSNNLEQSEIKVYLSGGLIIDSLETILVLNEIINYNKDENREIKTSQLPNELKNFKKDVKKTAYQFLGLIFENPKKMIYKSNINTEDIIENIKKLANPNKEETKTQNPEDIKEISEKPNLDKEENLNNENLESKVEILKENIKNLNQANKFQEAMINQQKLVKIAKKLKIDKSEINKIQEDSNQKTLFNF